MTGPTREEVAPTIEAAHDMGSKGGPVVEAERLAFEAWMHGHCWSLGATWNGKEYRSDSETGFHFDPHAIRTRELWAAWRDRAALAFAAGSRSGEDARDAARLDALQAMTKGYGRGWILRESVTGRGMRLHETSQEGAHSTVRAAIDAAMGGNDGT